MMLPVARSRLPKIGIIAALEREIGALVREPGWRVTKVVRSAYRSYENDVALVACAGIGGSPARKTAEDVVSAIHPAMLLSVGIAGALVPRWKIGMLMVPETILWRANDLPRELHRSVKLTAIDANFQVRRCRAGSHDGMEEARSRGARLARRICMRSSGRILWCVGFFSPSALR